MCSVVKKLQNVVSDLVTNKEKKSSDVTISTNSQCIHKSDPIPVDDLFVLKGKLNGLDVQVLKDDGCNTNLVSKKFVEKNRNCFNIKKKKIPIHHSKKGSDEMACEYIANGTLMIGSHTYTSNWVVGDSRYDILLGMPWHVANNPEIDYVNRAINLEDKSIQLKNHLEDETADISAVKVTNIGVKKFRKLLRKKSKKVEI